MAMSQPKRPPRTHSRTYINTNQIGHEQEYQNDSVLERLITMGFSQARSEKAIAVTGSLTEDKLGDCVNWLLTHSHDYSVENEPYREYMLYICPASGPLSDMLDKFWSDTKSTVPNGAHESFPHIRLTTFFKVADSMMERLVHTVQTVVTTSLNIQSSFDLEYQSLQDSMYKYVGLFVSDSDDAKLHELAEELATQAEKIGIQLDPYTRHMHMSLAYRFPEESLPTIEDIASCIDVTAKCQWELRIYSRDCRTPSHELREVTHAYEAQQSDEISLVVGDIIFTEPDSIQSSVDGWYYGFSQRDGNLAQFPGNYTMKTAHEHKTWTKVIGIPLVGPQPSSPKSSPFESVAVCDRDGFCTDEHCSIHAEELSFLFVRHAERVDAVMGKEWVKNCFEDNGKEKFMKRFNLNMPDDLVKRRNHFEFSRDPPITEIGRLQCELIGRALATSPLTIKAVYSSPSLRCIETAQNIIKRFPEDKQPLIRIENCLFEWNRWHSVLPTFMPAEELKTQGFNVDTSYKPQMLAFDLMESLEKYHDRTYTLLKNLIDKHSRSGGCVLLIGHAATPEVAIRKLSKKPLRPQREFVALINKVPFCEPIMTCRNDEGRWEAATPPIPKLWHLDNKKFDINILN